MKTWLSGEEHANIEYVFVLLPSDPVSPPPHTIWYLFRPCRHLSYSQPSPLLVHFAHSHIRLPVLTHLTQTSPNPRILLHLALSNRQRRLALPYDNDRPHPLSRGSVHASSSDPLSLHSSTPPITPTHSTSLCSSPESDSAGVESRSRRMETRRGWCITRGRG